jgi:hypothetical protein
MPGAVGRCSRVLRPGFALNVQYHMSKVTILHHGFVIPKNICVRKSHMGNYHMGSEATEKAQVL